MYFQKIQPIQNECALFIEDKKILIISDLHIGIEYEFKLKGINIPSKTEEILDRLMKICKKKLVKEIYIIGDIKHKIPIPPKNEKVDVRRFLKFLTKIAKIHIIPGNHDGKIKWFLNDEVILHDSDGFVFENIGLIHGHKWPNNEIMKCDLIIMGHTHPTVMFEDRLGYRVFEACWVRTNFIKEKLENKYPDSLNPGVVIMPAFNPLCGGIAINTNGIIGPIGKIIDIKNSDVYLINGISIGKIRDL
jgi:putative SbcD/Mre11-related phosphoesterase